MKAPIRGLLIHVLKIISERKITGSWKGSIYSDLREIDSENTRDDDTKLINSVEEWEELIKEDLIRAADKAAWECSNGYYKGSGIHLLSNLNLDEVVNLSIYLLQLAVEHNLSKESIEQILQQYGYQE